MITDTELSQHLFKLILQSDYEAVTAHLKAHKGLLKRMQTSFKRSPLNMAIEKNDLKMVEILISFGAMPFQKAYSDQFDLQLPPYHLAKRLGYKEICSFLEPLAEDKTVLFIDFSEK